MKNEDAITRPVHPPLAGIAGLKPGKETVVLVTGASAGVGGDMAKALLDAGYSVRASVSNSIMSVNYRGTWPIRNRPPP